MGRLPRRTLRTAAAALCLVPVSGCGLLGTADGDETPDYQELVIAMPDWTGGQATAAMAAYVLEYEFGRTVTLWSCGQETAWDKLGTGAVHAIMEDWGALPDRRQLYVEEKQNVTDAGALGITGHAGWYVPEAYADAHPGVLRAENLDAFAADLGGEVLHADPYYATWDDEIIDELDLDYRPVAVGSEEALVERLVEAERQREPVLTYLWQPHWLNTEVDLAEVELPGDHYPDIEPRKYLNAYFAEHDEQVAEFLRNFTWSEADQNAVARLIAEDGYTPRAAAERWATNHPQRIREWLPEEE